MLDILLVFCKYLFYSVKYELYKIFFLSKLYWVFYFIERMFVKKI